MQRTLTCIGLSFILLFFSSKIAASSFPATEKLGGQTLVLNGSATRRAFIIFRVYKIALYLKEKSSDASEILKNPMPFVVKLSFVRSVEAKDIQESFQASVEKNFPPFESDKEKKLLNKFLQSFKNPGSDTLWSFEVDKDTITVLVEGKKLFQEKSAFLARHLLKIWLGPAPPSERLKNDLLGK